MIARVTMLLTFAGACAPALGGDEPFFTGLGDLPGGLFLSSVWGISADGRVAIGSSVASGAFGDVPFGWTLERGMFSLSAGSDFIGGTAVAASGDGAVIVGGGTRTNGRGEAFYWTPDEGLRGLGDLPGGEFWSSAMGVSADGTVIVGFGHPDSTELAEAFRWTADTGMVGLGDLPGGPYSSVASATNADGSIIVGVSGVANGLEAFMWSEPTGMIGLGDLPGGSFNGIARYVSHDGRVVAGTSDGMDPDTGVEGFRWTLETGMVPLLDRTNEMFQLSVHGMTADGAIIVGRANLRRGGIVPFIWDEQQGARDFEQILRDQYALVPHGWILLTGMGISADGRTIVGNGFNPDGQNEAWIAYLGPPPCPSDVDGDGSVGLSDLGILLRWFGTSVIGTHDRGDVNFDGDVDLQDLGLMLSAFGTTCP